MNPYRELGVDKSALIEEVRAAYRAKALRAHPDTGGSSEEFDRLKRAHDILTDLDRRSDYDRTGNTQELPDATLQMALTILDARLMELVGDVRIGVEQDLVALLIATLQDDIIRLKIKKGEIDSTKARAERLAKRFQKKAKKPAAPDFVGNLFLHRIRSMEAAVAESDRQIEARSRAINILGDYEFMAGFGFERSANSTLWLGTSFFVKTKKRLT